MNESMVTFLALMDVCKWIRQNPPAKFPQEDFEIWCDIFAGGENEDPEGVKIMSYFINRIKKEAQQHG